MNMTSQSHAEKIDSPASEAPRPASPFPAPPPGITPTPLQRCEEMLTELATARAEMGRAVDGGARRAVARVHADHARGLRQVGGHRVRRQRLRRGLERPRRGVSRRHARGHAQLAAVRRGARGRRPAQAAQEVAAPRRAVGGAGVSAGRHRQGPVRRHHLRHLRSSPARSPRRGASTGKRRRARAATAACAWCSARAISRRSRRWTCSTSWSSTTRCVCSR